jgi:hypothetical protein
MRIGLLFSILVSLRTSFCTVDWSQVELTMDTNTEKCRFLSTRLLHNLLWTQILLHVCVILLSGLATISVVVTRIVPNMRYRHSHASQIVLIIIFCVSESPCIPLTESKLLYSKTKSVSLQIIVRTTPNILLKVTLDPSLGISYEDIPPVTTSEQLNSLSKNSLPISFFPDDTDSDVSSNTSSTYKVILEVILEPTFDPRSGKN